jgi:hypothetical protein
MTVFVWLRRHAGLIIAGAVPIVAGGGKTMKVECPHCGKTIDLGRGTGRKPLNISVKFVCDALQKHGTVAAAASELGCSRGYVYKILKEAGIRLTE